ncbi:putative secreted RxLR effector peptide protein [Phytophthora cinnamomi]|uniref:putative secreted RxLR effector peptide protein n=1 Tax=Phytophthora cinnamomi TaxID=4785 RepID=UPI002A31E8CC|nr:putative secreted RxLR effector peptide protein [Phytophthora cinnamomi]KAJ8525973.1 hypothetical protein ON010_g15199 [Phytophthora cinnamomi]
MIKCVKCVLLFVTVLSLLASAEVLSAPTTSSEITSPDLSISDGALAVQMGKDNKRSFRGLKTTDDAATEERTSTTELAQKFKTVLSQSKPVQILAAVQKARIEKREAFIQKLVDGKVNYATLHANKVTGDEYYKVLGVTSADMQFGHLMTPKLRKARGYVDYLEIKDKQRRGF